MSSSPKPVVVVATVDTAQTVAAFKKAAKLIPGAVFHFVYVIPAEVTPPPLVTSKDAQKVPLVPEVEKFFKDKEVELTAHSKDLLGKFQDLATEAGVESKAIEIRSGLFLGPIGADPREELCKYCKNSEASLLVMGTGSPGTAHGWFFGSVSEYCTKNAPCPVFIDHEVL